MISRFLESNPRTLLILALLAAVAYAPMFSIPLLEDDFANLWQSANWGSFAGFPELLHNPVFRMRATSYWMMFLLWHVSKLHPFVYHLASLLLHIANTWLLYGICLAWPRMRAAAFWAAAFFAVQEGHQEAVMWFSAINELLLFLFGAGAILCWLRLQARDRAWILQLSAIGLFGLALLSKESAIVILPLILLATGRAEWRRSARRLIPYAVLASLAIASIVSSRNPSFRFSDGSFSLHAPFWITLPRNYFRVLWLWGIPALAVITTDRGRTLRATALIALAWIGLGLVPYSFLTSHGQNIHAARV